jgi:hypothetical protein
MQEPHIDVESVDAERIAAVSKALGARRFGELLALLCMRLQRLAAAIEHLPADAAGLAAGLHQSRGSAASLGLVGLAEAMIHMEAQIARALGGAEPSMMAEIKIAARALHDYGNAASRAASHHVQPVVRDQASGICNR